MLDGRRRRPAAASRRALALRTWLAALVAMLIATLVARSGHMTLVSHAICADHGELVHGDHHAGAAAEPRDVETAALVGSEHDDGHDHCDALATEETLVADTPAFELRLLSWLEPPWRMPALAAIAPRTRLLLAPKTSPPA